MPARATPRRAAQRTDLLPWAHSSATYGVRCLRERNGRVSGGSPVEPCLEEATTGGRDAGQQDPADDVVAEAEMKAVDAEDAVLAEAFELFGELGRVHVEDCRKRFRLERLLEHRRSEEHAVGVHSRGAALAEQSVGKRR